ncbi:MAG: UDP-N-acetylmuramoyl-L-alanyl-D-glutamate--2,6-diaminopimelate ligase [Elusimicrobiota bacterium]|jgi:UDP-N-acetylmuramoyl-L-alanyl-D-glutamate--2,6-diaminopimelate ligase|nr:UDP-N-acetylmuramoyl-L-alanyl-D-glutamate--2,6-diaminopimelate ligase [Elusimicrobiota bacterium]
MTLKELFAEYNADLPDTEVTGLTQNSADSGPGVVFFAVKGASVDGHDFIDDAVKRGAVAVVSAAGFDAPSAAPVIKVDDIDAAMAAAACKFYGGPSRALNIIGITGTKGKTSISYLLESIFFAAGRAPAVFGTINYRVNGKVISKAPNTTPAALTLQKLIAQAAAQGSKDLVMEVSSHALELKRVAGIDFNAAVFTNLQRDHLDFHNNFENYFAAKLKLFENLAGPQNVKQNRAAIINIDDEYGQKLAALLKGRVKVITYGIDRPADFTAADIKPGLEGVDFKINGQTAHINLLGAHNVYNALAAVASANHDGIDMMTALKGIAALKGVPGRMERVDLGQNFYVFVDFAYTNEAMQRAFDAVSPFKKGRLTMVFGCGGQRDTTKRPLMGATAARCADLVLITKDNPRKEDAANIFIDILRGMGGQDNYKVIPDRREAIFEAVQKACAGDIVIIAGKGHEDYQILPAGTIHFSDREQAEEAIKTYVQSAKI